MHMPCLRRGGAWLIAVPLLAASLRGQTPPAATVVAGGALSGVVSGANGSPLAGVAVTLLGEAVAARTDSTGRFALRDVAPGAHTALFRRLGYRSIEYRWLAESEKELQIAVTMTVLPRQLERVIVEAPGTSRRRGTSSIGGTVNDSTGNAVVGADVRLLGSGLSTVTDSTGSFEFRQLAAGTYIVKIRRRGLRSTSHVVQIVDDDHRGISFKLYGLPRKTRPRDVETASGYGIADQAFEAFDRRERSGSGPRILGPGDLFRANRAPLDVVLQAYRDVASIVSRRRSILGDGAGSTEDGDCLLIDGRRAEYVPLGSFSSSDVQLVEVLRPGALVDPLLLSLMDAFGQCRGDMEHHPTYFVLWTRALR